MSPYNNDLQMADYSMCICDKLPHYWVSCIFLN